MADFPELYSQLLQGQYFQFCEVVANPIRSQVAMLACPIFDDQGVLGDLWLFKQKDAAFEDLEIRLVQQIANQCAIAIRQARLYQAAQTQVEKLEALNQLKDDFLSTVSHELRTPLSNIKMAIQMLKLSPNAERRQRYLEILQTECNRETDLINDLLDLQRLEATAYPTFLTEAVNLPEWIPTIVEPFRSRIQEHQQILQIDLAPNLPVLISDRANLARILAELINNACKYTPAKGAIALDVCCDRSSYSPLDATPRVSFIVSNEAEIPATELPRIFEKFYRIPHADPWKQGGTGLGLALVQKLVEQLKGTIAVESKDAKTVFTITLPVRPG
jgi:signal transduction histidine kinase